MIRDFKRKDDKLDKAARKAEIRRLRDMLVSRQHAVRDARLPVIVLLEGWDCAPGRATSSMVLVASDFRRRPGFWDHRRGADPAVWAKGLLGRLGVLDGPGVLAPVPGMGSI